MANKRNFLVGVCCMLPALVVAAWTAGGLASDVRAETVPETVDGPKGICVVLGVENEQQASFVTALGKGLVYFQSPDEKQIAMMRKAAERSELLGKHVFVDRGGYRSIHLADNLADAVIVAPDAAGVVAEEELLRVLRPGGTARIATRKITKPAADGTGAWSHPYHGPDNNPQSADRLARAPYLTQYLAYPKFSPMPEVTVAAGGRVFRAMGHIAHRANQNPQLNTLLGVNAYNGTILWRRPLKEGFMIHRNTMIATPEVLYLADDESCKLIDAATGETKDQIVVPKDLADGPVWKWMAIADGVLYALIGGQEVKPRTQPSQTQALGHWPWGMWEGHDYSDPKTNFGFGRTFVAIDPKTKRIRWSYRDDDYLDSRGVCMSNGRIYFYCPEKFLACLDAKTGKTVWKTSDAKLLEAIGPNERAQHYVTGYSTTTYIKCNDKYIFFAGPQRSRLVVARAEDGKLLWQKPHGNYQLVLRDDAIYAAGPGDTGCKLDYATGEQLAPLPLRRACTRATGTADSVFYRTPGGTVRVDVATGATHHIAPMRPPCQDGVIVSDGLLFWGPWMCGCQLSLYGHVCLAPAGDFPVYTPVDKGRLEPGTGDITKVDSFEVAPGDWPCYRLNNQHRPITSVAIPREVKRQWTFRTPSKTAPTAPVAAGGLVFIGDRSGAVHAIDAEGKVRWKAHTGAAIFFPPVVADGRVFVGSADGRVYAFEATTGRRLWTFRVAPADRFIPVYERLISTWPVAGGVVVAEGVVYAAAGIAHYDGTHVVALDAATGKVKWYNDTSGSLSEKVDSGISLQGPLYVRGGELCFLGGGVYHTARYDLATGKCLNPPHEAVNSQFATAFYPYYPSYGRFSSLGHTLPDGNSLVYTTSYEGSRHSRLALLAPPEPAAARPAPATDRRAQAPQRKALWQDPAGRRFNGFIVGRKTLVAAGQNGPSTTGGLFLDAVDVRSGQVIWHKELPAAAVKDGTAIDAAGRIVVSLEDGSVLCFAGP